MGSRRSGGGGLGLGSLVAGGASIAALGKIGGAGLDAQAKKASLEVLAGSSAAGQKMFNELNKYAQDSIFGNEVFKNAQTLKAFGAANKDVLPDMRMLGDISMGNKQRLEGLTLAYSQSMATGRLMGQDLNQMINAGFNPLKVISEQTGRSMASLKDDMSKGLITFDMVKGAFQAATSEGGQFYGMTDKIAKTDFGKVEAFKGQIAGLAMQFGSNLAPTIGNLITNYLAPLGTWIGEHIDLVTGLGGVLLTGVGAYKAVTIAQGLLNVVMSANPIGLIVGGIAALTAGFVYAYNKSDKFRGMILGTWRAVKSFATLIKDVVIDRLKTMVSGITGIGKAIYLFFQGKFKEGMQAGKDAVLDLTGINTAKKARAGAKNIGAEFNKGYKEGVAQIKAKDDKAAKVADSNGMAGFGSGVGNTSGTGANGNAFAGLSSGSGDSSTASGITGGGSKTVNVTVHKMFDNIVIHSQNMNESYDQLEARVQEIFYRLMYSLNAG